MDADQILAFRLARSGLAARDARGLAEAAACPASDFARDAALLALAARAEDVTREAYDQAVDAGDLVVAHIVRGAIHALAPGRLRASTAGADRQRRRRARRAARPAGQRLAGREGLRPDRGAGRGGGGHARRARERPGAGQERAARGAPRARPRGPHAVVQRLRSYHVAPMLWRYATVQAGVRLDSERRYSRAGRAGRRRASEAARRFLASTGRQGPATSPSGRASPSPTPAACGTRWPATSRRSRSAGARRGSSPRTWPRSSRPRRQGIRLLPPGDPYLQKANRPLLAADPELRKRLFRPVASPGAVLRTAAWRALARQAEGEDRGHGRDARPPRARRPRGGGPARRAAARPPRPSSPSHDAAGFTRMTAVR